MKLDRLLKVFTFLFSLLILQVSWSQPFTKAPDQLKKWQGWVLKDVSDFRCLSSWTNFEDKVCHWPGPLNIAVQKRVAKFDIEWTLYEEGYVDLPGSENGLWPLNVQTKNGKNLVVIEREGRPAVFLEPGRYEISGNLRFSADSDRLVIPRGVGSLSLSVNGKSVSYPEYDAQGRLLFRRKAPLKTTEKERLELKVYRKLIDSIPAEIEVYLDLSVSGGEREVTLANPLSNDFIAIEIISSLNTRLDKKDGLKVRVRPGSWSVLIKGRAQRPYSKVTLQKLPRPYPSQEIWVFSAQNNLRLVDVSGADQIDGGRANLPSSFKGLPSYLIRAGSGLEFKEKSRGLSFVGKNQLSLNREMWLDFNGGHYTFRDHVSGTMKKGWRLDMGSPYELGAVKISGKSQVITTGNKEGLRGLELRQKNVNLIAQGRVQNKGKALSHLGWQSDFHQVKGSIHLPPGHEAIWLGGVDHVTGTWFSKWSLLSLFLVLLLSIGVFKLKGLKWGAITFIAMVLLIHEEGAPTTLWVHLLIALALERALTAKEKFSKMVRYYRIGTIFVLLAVAFPFIVNQIQTSIFPSLEESGGRKQFMSNLVSSYDSMSPARNVKRSRKLKKKSVKVAESIAQFDIAGDMAMKEDMPAAPGSKGYGGGGAAQVARQGNIASYNEYDPKAIVQTGPGLPQWRWGTLKFRWDGPVSQSQKVNLVFLRPWAKKILVLLRLIFLGLLMFCLMDWESLKKSGQLRFLEELLPLSRRGANLFILFFIGLGLFFSPNLEAQDFPSKEILKEYRKELLKSPSCYPQCGTIEKAAIKASANQLEIRLSIHMQEKGYIAIPGSIKEWMPAIVVEGGKRALVRVHNNLLNIALKKGVHTVTMRGGLPPRAQIQLNFPVRPFHFSYQGPLWSLDGLDAKGKVSGTISLVRKASDKGKGKRFEDLGPSQLPAYLKVDRTFNFGVKWTVQTVVRRLTSAKQAVSFTLKKLPGESILSSQVIETDEGIKVNLDSGQYSLTYQSVLTPQEKISLKALENNLLFETWNFVPGPIWKVDLQSKGSLVPISNLRNNRFSPIYRPWPGEEVIVMAVKPEGASGNTKSLISSDVEITPGKRLSRFDLKLELITSKGSTHDITLPEGAQLDEVKVNGSTQSLQLKDKVLSLPLGVGKQSVGIKWHLKKGVTTMSRAPIIDVGMKGVNHKIKVRVPQNRWVLALGGPVMGPAVLFWGKLITLLIIAFLLGKLAWCPLGFGSWAVLFIGMTQSSQGGIYWVAATLLFLCARKKWLLNVKPWLYNVQTIGAGLMTFVSIGLLLEVLQQGLLGNPIMNITGNGSSRYFLTWFVDRHENLLPDIWVLSTPQWIYQVLMLIWAIWMSLTIVKWVPWLWQGIYGDGFFKSLSLSWKKNKSGTGEPPKAD